MTAKEYLSQARRLDMKIDMKLEQIMRLRTLAEKRTSVLTGMPHGGAGDRYDLVARIVDKERELDADIDRLLILQNDIRTAIAAVPDDVQRTLLELRYLNGRTWEEISVAIPCERTTTWRIHGRALQNVVPPGKDAIVCNTLDVL